MSDEDNANGVVIDVEPDAEEKKPDEPGNSKQTLPILVAVVAILLAIAAGAIGYQQIKGLRATLGEMQQSVQQAAKEQEGLTRKLQQARDVIDEKSQEWAAKEAVIQTKLAKISEQNEKINEQRQRLAEARIDMENREAELRAAVADVQTRMGSSSKQWLVEEAGYLMSIASQRLRLSRDGSTAAEALGLADERLRDTKDPAWSGVREQLARDIATALDYREPDYVGISARLGALSERVEELKLANDGVPKKAPSAGSVTNKDERSVENLVNDLLGGVEDAIRIRRTDRPLEPILSPEQQFFLYENVRLQIESARLSLLRREVLLFKSSIDIALQWIDRFFVLDDTKAKSFIAELNALKNLDINPVPPDISGSLRALQGRQKLMKTKLHAAKPEEQES